LRLAVVAFPALVVVSGVPLSLEPNAELGIRFLMSSRIKCRVSGTNVLWERTAGDFTPHYPKTLLLSGDRLVGEEDARVDDLVVFVRLAAHGLFICWSLERKSPVDELWKHSNPPSADYIENNVIKD